MLWFCRRGTGISRRWINFSPYQFSLTSRTSRQVKGRSNTSASFLKYEQLLIYFPVRIYSLYRVAFPNYQALLFSCDVEENDLKQTIQPTLVIQSRNLTPLQTVPLQLGSLSRLSMRAKETRQQMLLYSYSLSHPKAVSRRQALSSKQNNQLVQPIMGSIKELFFKVLLAISLILDSLRSQIMRSRLSFYFLFFSSSKRLIIYWRSKALPSQLGQIEQKTWLYSTRQASTSPSARRSSECTLEIFSLGLRIVLHIFKPQLIYLLRESQPSRIDFTFLFLASLQLITNSASFCRADLLMMILGYFPLSQVSARQ